LGGLENVWKEIGFSNADIKKIVAKLNGSYKTFARFTLAQ
jgi:hypothetical protein